MYYFLEVYLKFVLYYNHIFNGIFAGQIKACRDNFKEA
jgi:hypothetical protein